MNSLEESKRRWRLVLGNVDQEAEDQDENLSEGDQIKDRALDFLFSEERGSGSGNSRQIKRWLKDIRSVFDHESVAFLQKEAIDKFNVKELLLESEFLENAEPNVHLLKEILGLRELMNNEQASIARDIITKIVKEIEKKLIFPTLLHVKRGLKKQIHQRQSQPEDIHWHKTIQANLKHYQADHKSIIPEIWKGYQKTTPSLKNIVLLIDQSASMSESVIYAGIFGCILTKIRSLGTQAMLFDSDVVDISHDLEDSVELLMGLQLGGGTQIGNALSYARSQIRSPRDTVFFLISDLEDTGDRQRTLSEYARIVESGVRCYNILAMSDEGRPRYDKEMAEDLNRLGIPFGYCTTEEFPLLLASMLN